MSVVIYKKKNPLLRWLVEEEEWLVEESLSCFWEGKAVQVEIGFHTDLASIPRLLRSLIPQVGRHIQPAIFHDLLYRTVGHLGFTRAEADQMFLDGMKASGVGWLKRYTMYWGVRSGGWITWNSHDDTEKGAE